MKVIINGACVPIRQSLKTSFDPTRGVVTTEIWKMAGGDRLAGQAAQYKARGYQYDLDSNARISTLTVTSPTPQGGEEDVATDQWQMMANEINLDIYESPGAKSLSVARLAMVKLAVKDHEDGDTVDLEAWITTEGDVAAGIMTSLFLLVIKGVRFFPVGQHVLRHTTNVSADYVTNVADENIDCIYSNGQLNTEIGNALYWTYPAPARFRAMVSNRPTGTTDGGDLRWGWRKLPSNETTAPNNRIDITTEYWFAGYPYFLYDDAS